jgi:hypothetical protein
MSVCIPTYKVLVLTSHRLLLIEYVAATASDDKAENAIARKDKQPLPFPVCQFSEQLRLFGLIQIAVLLLAISANEGAWYLLSFLPIINISTAILHVYSKMVGYAVCHCLSR